MEGLIIQVIKQLYNHLIICTGEPITMQWSPYVRQAWPALVTAHIAAHHYLLAL